jgi:hypothetical protein
MLLKVSLVCCKVSHFQSIHSSSSSSSTNKNRLEYWTKRNVSAYQGPRSSQGYEKQIVGIVIVGDMHASTTTAPKEQEEGTWCT